MPTAYTCPYWSWEKCLKLGCDMATLKFPDQSMRNSYIRSYCASLCNWENCSIAKALNEKYEKEGQA